MLSQPLPDLLLVGLFLLGAVMEMLVPVIAQRKGTTSWHRHHMIERYGLLNIIVLGETLLAGSLAIRHLGAEYFSLELIRIVLSSMVILFSLWWLYFSKEQPIRERRLSTVFIWAYGHLMIYAAGGAVGAGFSVMIDVATHHSSVNSLMAYFAISIPVSVYMLGLWLVRDRYVFNGVAKLTLPFIAILIALSAFLQVLECVAFLAVLAVVLRNQKISQV